MHCDLRVAERVILKALRVIGQQRLHVLDFTGIEFKLLNTDQIADGFERLHIHGIIYFA